MTASIVLLHGDDSFGLDLAVRDFAGQVDASDRIEVIPERSPDEAAIDRARLEAGTMSMFGAHLTVLRQPLRAAGRSSAAADRLVALIEGLTEGTALALVEHRPSRDVTKPPALLRRLADAVRARGGRVEEVAAPRRGDLRSWITARAARTGVAIEVKAAHLLADRLGGSLWETDVERGEMTRIADSELRKLATYADGRAISAADVEALTADTRPPSVFAITNALDRREPAAMADALRRALADGEPGLRILASLAGRVSDLIVARELAASRAAPSEIARQIARGNARMAERLVEATKRYRGEELDAMLVGLWEADVAIKSNMIDEEPALVAWVGRHVLGGRAAGAASR